MVGRGAAVPYVEYEAESARYQGTLLDTDPLRTFGHTNFATESSGRKSVKLTGTGQFVEFTSTNAGEYGSFVGIFRALRDLGKFVFSPSKYFDKRELKHIDRFLQFGVAAAMMAMEDAGHGALSLSSLRAGRRRSRRSSLPTD